MVMTSHSLVRVTDVSEELHFQGTISTEKAADFENLTLFYHSTHTTRKTMTLKENIVYITNVFYIPSDSTSYRKI